MNAASLAFVVAFALFASNATAQRHDEKPHGASPASSIATAQGSVVPADADSKVVPLADGGTLIIHRDGTAYHADASGRRVRMKNGTTMEAKDGTRYLMTNDAVWQAITQKGSLHPNHQ